MISGDAPFELREHLVATAVVAGNEHAHASRVGDDRSGRVDDQLTRERMLFHRVERGLELGAPVLDREERERRPRPDPVRRTRRGRALDEEVVELRGSAARSW